jgi:hypothetical protein
MGSPPDSNTALRTAESLRHALVAPGQYESERARPVACGEVSGSRGQLEVQSREHVAARDEQKKGLAGWPSLQVDERLYRLVVRRSPKPIDGFGGIAEHLPCS